MMDKDYNEFRDWLAGKLAENIMKIVFTKADESRRDMVCTLIPRYLPSIETKSDVARKENTDVLRVWDINAEAWRSFRMDSIISYDFVSATENV